MKVNHIENIDQAKAMAIYLWNEVLRHEKGIRGAKEDIKVLEKKWGIKVVKKGEIEWWETK